jgi:PAS domain S-box-containing protein
MLIGIILTLAIPLAALYVIWLLEIYAFSNGRVVLGALAWGMVSFALAYWIQSPLLNVLPFEVITTVSAPVIEEVLKALFLLGLTSRLLLRYSAEGTVYGFATGIGFAIAENLFYLSRNPANALDIVAGRVFSVTLMHAFVTAIVGASIGAVVFQSRRRQVTILSYSLALAFVLHAAFNVINLQVQGVGLLVLGVFIGISGTVLLIIQMRHALQAEGNAIKLALASELSAGEVAASRSPQVVARMVQAHQPAIGAERSVLVQEYVTLQAQRGIIRKTLNLSQRTGTTRILQEQLTTVEQRLNSLENSMGAYTRAWLRSLLPSEESGTWEQLDADLAEDQPLLARLIELNQRQAVISADELEARTRFLHTVYLFRGMSAETLEDLALLLHKVEVEAGAQVIEQGAFNDEFHLVAAGSVNIYMQNDLGQTIPLTTVEPGGFYGELSMIDARPATASVMCITPATLYVLSRTDLVTLMYARPEAATVMMNTIVGRLRNQTIVREDAEKQLRESELRFRSVTESAVDAIVSVDSGLNIIGWNQGAARIFQYVEADVLGLPLGDILVDDSVLDLEASVTDGEFNLLNLTGEQMARRKDGTLFPVEISMSTWKIRGEQFYTGIIRDITRRKELEAHERAQRELAEALRDTAIAVNSTLDVEVILDAILTNLARVVHFANYNIMMVREGDLAETVRSQGYRPERSAPGLPGRLVLSLPVQETWVLRHMAETLAPLLIQDTVAHPGWVVTPESVWIRSYLGVPIHAGGQVLGFINLDSETVGAFSQDDAVRLQAYAEQVALALNNAQLFNELKTRNQEIDTFNRTVGHSLRIPLTTVIGYAQMLLTERLAAALSEEEKADYLNTIWRVALKMNKTIQELMLLSEAHKIDVLDTAPLDMASVLDQVWPLLAHLVDQYQPQIVQPDDWPLVLGHASWIQGVWFNYIENAIQYGGRPPVIELGADPAVDGMVRFWIKDNGPGIAPEHLGDLFVPLSEVDPARAEGHGLGLATVRRVVELHGGTVSVGSAPGHGSIFAFTLPLAQSPEA